MEKCYAIAQREINAEIEQAINDFNNRENPSVGEWVRLRNCQAWVIVRDEFYVLKSYHTIIAFIDTKNGTLYDFLRMVYGYSSTSSCHIAKFAHDYPCFNRLTWREV